MPSKKRKKQREYITLQVDKDFYANVLKPLLGLFSVVDFVMCEADIFENERKMRASLGRIYEEWKRCRVRLDPGFDPERYSHDQRPKEWLPKTVRAAQRRAATD